MAYITNVDIQERLGADAYVQLTDDDGDNQANVGVVDAARLAAEGEVDIYLARRYAVPIDLTDHPEVACLLSAVALDLVEYRLRSRRPPTPPEALIKRVNAVEWLARVAEGSVDLPALTSPTATSLRGTVAETSGSDRVVSREEMSDF
jgi:phage gp36-like protein